MAPEVLRVSETVPEIGQRPSTDFLLQITVSEVQFANVCLLTGQFNHLHLSNY